MSEIHPKITCFPVYPGGCNLREKLSCKYLIHNNLIEDYINVIFDVIFVAKLPEDDLEDYMIGNLRRTLFNSRFPAIKASKITSRGVYGAYVIFDKPEIDISPENKLSNTLGVQGLKSGKRFQFTSDVVR